MARYPWVLDFRLVDVVGSVPLIPETTESTENRDIRRYFYELGRARFTAVSGNRRVNVELGQDDKLSTSGHEMTFEVRTYIRGSIPIANNRLYILELDDGNKAPSS